MAASFVVGIGVGSFGLDRRPSATVDDVQRPLTADSSSICAGYTETTAYADSFQISPDLSAKIIRAARENHVPLRIAFRLVREESSFDPSAVSSVGALGLTQIKRSTARIYRPNVTAEDLLQNERLNLALGYAYLADMYERFDTWEAALMAYVDGPTDYESGSEAGFEYAEDVLKR